MTDIVTEMGEPGEVWRLSKTVRRVLANNPGIMTGLGTNTYIVGDGPVVIIDPGPEDPEHLDAVEAATRGREVRSIIVTHHHIDHWQGARTMARRFDTLVWSHGPAGDLTPDRRFPSGALQFVPGARLRALHTPGHASDHLCLVLQEEDAVFTGDTVIGGWTPVIAPPDGNMAEYMSSLALIRRAGPKHFYPGHGPAIPNAVDVLDEYVAHRKERELSILAAVVGGAQTVPEIVEAVYTDVPTAMHPIARYTVVAHLERLIDLGEVDAPIAAEMAEPAADPVVGGMETPGLPVSAPPLMDATFRPVMSA